MTTELDRIKALETELAALKAQISARTEAEVKKVWNPSGGSFTIGSDSYIRHTADNENIRDFGFSYPTLQQAEQAVIAMRKHNRLLAYVTEAITNSDNPNWVADWSNHNTYKYKIYVDSRNGYYKIDSNSFAQELGQIYMPENIARELVKKLNNGEVVL